MAPINYRLTSRQVRRVLTMRTQLLERKYRLPYNLIPVLIIRFSNRRVALVFFIRS